VKEYETALQALQRKRYEAAAASFRRLIDRYPEELELHERAQLYLRVCERESEPPPAPPGTLDERIYAATLALNAGAPDEAITHLEPAAAEAPDDDHVHYMMAVAMALTGRGSEAVEHLRRAIELNAENRVLARQEPDFAALRDDEVFRRVVDSYSPVAGGRRRGRPRPKG
jgi:tetratricopeptide (TPR) repeat protein